MDDERFDRWMVAWGERRTRRGFGALAAGVIAACGVGMDADAKKKKKKKKKKLSGICIEIGQACSGSGCCSDLECKPIFNTGPADLIRCCRSAGECQFAADCCRGTYCGGGKCRTCKGEGEDCFAGQCCPGSFCSILVPPGPGKCTGSD